MKFVKREVSVYLYLIASACQRYMSIIFRTVKCFDGLDVSSSDGGAFVFQSIVKCVEVVYGVNIVPPR